MPTWATTNLTVLHVKNGPFFRGLGSSHKLRFIVANNNYKMSNNASFTTLVIFSFLQ